MEIEIKIIQENKIKYDQSLLSVNNSIIIKNLNGLKQVLNFGLIL